MKATAPVQEPPQAVQRFGRDDFEAIAIRAAAGDESALAQLPQAVAAAEDLYRSRKFNKVRVEVLANAMRVAIRDDVLTVDEEEHVSAVLDALGIGISDLQRRHADLWEEVVIARINDDRLPVHDDVGVLLKAGEVGHGAFKASTLKEVTVREYRGGSSGVSIPIGFGMRYRTSSTRGRSVVIGTDEVVDDEGVLAVTSSRSLFVGRKKTIEFRHDKLVGLNQFKNGLVLNVSNRQRSTKLRLRSGTSVAAALIVHCAGRYR